ncbi:MAG: hypothetical protein PS018_16640, partial [bacterium]|nr:hypothetical protein [bacterium]
LLQRGWSNDWLSIVHEVDHDHGLVRRMFRAARYEHHLCGEITIYRGTTSLDPTAATNGLSWTESRDVACWFAFRYPGAPIVLSARINASEVAYYDNAKLEQEVILRHAIRSSLDPDPSTWREGMERHADLLRRV